MAKEKEKLRKKIIEILKEVYDASHYDVTKFWFERIADQIIGLFSSAISEARKEEREAIFKVLSLIKKENRGQYPKKRVNKQRR